MPDAPMFVEEVMPSEEVAPVEVNKFEELARKAVRDYGRGKHPGVALQELANALAELDAGK